MISNDAKDRIRSAINIVDLVGSYMELRRQGSGYVSVCPFHDDHKPSMQVNPNRQSWKCWVCDIGGDIFSFVMKKEGVTFIDAIRMLADRAGIAIEDSPASRADDKKPLLDAMAWAVNEFNRNLTESPTADKAREYLASRGISDESIKKFKIGCSPESWRWLLDRWTSKSDNAEILKAAGLIAASDRGSLYDRFHGRIIFPINDQQSKPIAVGGRILPGEGSDRGAKYVNCNETRLYHKSQQLYGLDLARAEISKTRQAVVMEGYTDVIMAVQHGIHNAVACCGTALGVGHIKLLKHSCDSVVLLLDGDEAGQKRTNEILELFVSAQMDLRVLKLPNELDPCDYLMQFGGDKLKEQIAGAVDALEFKLDLVSQGFDPLTDTHQANAALQSILETLSRVDVNSESTKFRVSQMLSRISRRFGINEADLSTWMESIRKKAVSRSVQRNETESNDSSTEQAGKQFKYSDMNPLEIELFQTMAIDSHIAALQIEKCPLDRLRTATAKELFKAYQNAERQGIALDFQGIMSFIEDPSLKSVLVSVAEHSTRSEESGLTNYDRSNSVLNALLFAEESNVVSPDMSEDEILQEAIEWEEQPPNWYG